MVILRLAALASANVDRAVASIDRATFVRRSDGAYLEVAEAGAAGAIRSLAFAGVAAEATTADVGAPRALLPAIGIDLAPLAAGSVACDIVRVRPLSLSEATRELLRTRTDRGRESVRALIRGEDALLAWTRNAWASRDALRTRAVRRTLRPVIFDRAAMERGDLGGRSLASAGALTRWLFA